MGGLWDIEPLAHDFLRHADMARVGNRASRLSDDAIALLRSCHWSGNVRHLYRVLERALVHGGPEILPQHFDVDGLKADQPDSPGDGLSAPFPGELVALTADELAERASIIEALASGNVTRAAHGLGIPRRVLVQKLNRYRIPRPMSRPPWES